MADDERCNPCRRHSPRPLDRSGRGRGYPPPVPLLEAKGLVKSFRGRGTVVHGVSFRVEPGEVVGLLGPNGAGKTTSFRMAIGMLRADEGEVSLLGIPVNSSISTD